MAAPISTTNMTGLRTCTRGSSLRSASRRSAGAGDRRGRRASARRRLGHRRRPPRSSARLSSSTLTPGSPSTPRKRPSVFSSISSSTRSSGSRGPRRRAWPGCGVGLGDVRVDAGGRGGHGVHGDVGARSGPGVGPLAREVAAQSAANRSAGPRVVRPEVVEERGVGVVVGRTRGPGPGSTRVAACEVLADQARADDLPSRSTWLPSALLGKRTWPTPVTRAGRRARAGR